MSESIKQGIPRGRSTALDADHILVRVSIYVSSDTLPLPQTMAIGKAAKWISFAASQPPSASSSATHDAIHSTVSIADEKQFGLENVRDLHLNPHSILFNFFDPVSLEILGIVVLSHNSPSSLTFAQLRQLCTPNTLLLLPLPRPCHPIY